MPQELTGLARLSAYALCIIEFISRQTMDPHLYFEKKYASEINSAASCAEAVALIDSLVGWLADADYGAVKIAQLDDALSAQHMPSIGLLRSSHRGAAIALIERKRLSADDVQSLQRVVKDAQAAAADRALARESLVAE